MAERALRIQSKSFSQRSGPADRHSGLPADLAFRRDWDLQPLACAPYRARTKCKTEADVKYPKHNAVAALTYRSFAALEAHLTAWMAVTDGRIHGTT